MRAKSHCQIVPCPAQSGSCPEKTDYELVIYDSRPHVEAYQPEELW